MPHSPSTALVVGAGIGGLAAGIALRNAGFDVEIVEQAPEIRAAGAGISLWANAIRALDRLGAGDAIRAASVPYDAAGLRTSDGTVLASISTTMLRQRFAMPIVMMHRADLQGVLLESLRSVPVRAGKHCTGFEQDDEGVTAAFSDGSCRRTDLLIGADGLHSAIRASLHGASLPRYAGCTAWRAVVRFRRGRLEASESWGHGSVFGQVPMNGGWVYWYGTRNLPPGERSTSEKAELLRIFRGWHDPIEALIEAADDSAILRNDLYDREPLRVWGRGRVTLLGDAAHPMTPYLGQGGCQALEDAVTLGESLRPHGDVTAALQAYERLRIPRTNMFVRRSRIAGRIAQLERPLAVSIRNAAIRLIGSRRQTAQIIRMIGAGDRP